jgi:hypothetical protein
MAAYLRRYFPFEAANADLEEWVRTGLDRAAQYGFLTYNESAQYLALTAILGAGFVEDPQVPWAGETISGPDGTSLDRITRVYEKAIEYLEAISGPKCSWLLRAKLRVKEQDLTLFNNGVHLRALDGRIRELLLRLHPQKAAVVGEKALKHLAKLAIARSQERGAKSAQAALTHAVHMYYLGSEFDQDPCYEWAGAALADSSGGSMEERYVRMHHLLVDYLDRSF